MADARDNSAASIPRMNSLKARQASMIMYTDNNDEISNVESIRIENLADCVKISSAQSTALINKIKACRYYRSMFSC